MFTATQTCAQAGRFFLEAAMTKMCSKLNEPYQWTVKTLKLVPSVFSFLPAKKRDSTNDVTWKGGRGGALQSYCLFQSFFAECYANLHMEFMSNVARNHIAPYVHFLKLVHTTARDVAQENARGQLRRRIFVGLLQVYVMYHCFM